MENIRVVHVTIPRDKADDLARNLVEKRLAACVNVIGEVKSYFRWQGKISEEQEALLLIKTTQLKVEELIGYVRANHPYDLPEIISLPVAEGLPDYINWIIDESSIGKTSHA